MPRQKDFAWTHCTPIAGSTKVKCNWCLNDISGGIYHFKWHLAKEPGNNTTICLRCPADVMYQAKQALDGIGDIKAKKARTEVEIGSSSVGVRRNHLGEEDGKQGGFRESGSAPSSTACGPNTSGGNINDFFQPCTTLGSHTTLESTRWRENVHEQANKAIANFWYSSLPFHARSPYWQRMVDAIAAAGPGFQAPSYETLKVDMLKDAVQDVQDVVKEHRLQWATSGCTIVLDGWIDRRNHTLINFLVSCDIGTIFLKSVDASNKIKSAAALFEMYDSVVMDVGPQNVVQFITNDASTCVAVGRLLADKYPSMFFTPCVAHCLDLTLEDIGKIEWVKEVLQKAHTVTKFIYNHSRVLSIMHSFTGGKELVRTRVTKFATHFFALQTLCQQKMNLRRMFVSSEWMESSFTNQTDGIIVAEYMCSTSFWHAVEQIVEFSEPLVKVLRLVDEDKSPMGYLYEAMDRAKEVVRGRMENNRDRYMPLWDIIDSRWDGQMDSALHAAGYFLNPSLFYKTPFRDIDAKITQGFFKCMDKMFPSRDQFNEAMSELQMYEQARGFLSSRVVMASRKTLQPAQWWENFGDECKNLRWMAIRILTQPCSLSTCERNWSVFEHIYSKKCNRLRQQRMNDLVFVHHNLHLKLKKAQGTTKEDEPIDLDGIDLESEWIAAAAAADDDFLGLDDFDYMVQTSLDPHIIE